MHEDYFAIEAVNWSTLKHMADSPLAYRHAKQTQRADTGTLQFGRAVHTLVLEPHRFADEYVTWTGGKRQGKKWAEFQAEAGRRTILTKDMASEAAAVAAAVRTHPTVAGYLEGGLNEVPLTWTDRETGIWCKARPDIVKTSRVLIDLKTCRSVDGRRFGAAAAALRYPEQLAHYANGIEASVGFAPERWLLIAVEKEAPHDVGVFEVDPQARELAAGTVAELLRRLAECLRTDRWPGRYDSEQALQLPAWVYMDDDEADAEALGLSLTRE